MGYGSAWYQEQPKEPAPRPQMVKRADSAYLSMEHEAEVFREQGLDSGYGGEDTFCADTTPEPIPIPFRGMLSRSDSAFLSMEHEEQVFRDAGFDSGYGGEDDLHAAVSKWAPPV